MKERPILMSAPMVRALLAGRKTQTRRLVKKLDPRMIEDEAADWCPYGQPGDRLWVREAHQNCQVCGGFNFAADMNENCWNCNASLGKWRPSIFMPREWSRLTLELTAIRVERLWAISEADAKAEGSPFMPYRDSFANLWESIHGASSWAENPWIWVLTFRKLTS